MADNVTLNAGSGGATAAADDIGSVYFQRIKLIHGADGVNDGDVSNANPLPTKFRSLSVSGSISALNSNLTTSPATANSTVEMLDLEGITSGTCQVSGTFSGTIQLYGSNDGSTWYSIMLNLPFIHANSGIRSALAITGSELLSFTTCGCKYIRFSSTAWTSGTANLNIYLTGNPSHLFTVAGEQSVTITKVGSQSVGTNRSGTDSSVMRMTIGGISSATVANVSGSASSVTLLASNSARAGACFFNDSTATLYLKFGATASTSSYTVQIAPGGFYELPNTHLYTGIIDGIWSAANGACRVTSW